MVWHGRFDIEGVCWKCVYSFEEFLVEDGGDGRVGVQEVGSD